SSRMEFGKKRSRRTQNHAVWCGTNMGIGQGKVKANKRLNLLDFTAFLNAAGRNGGNGVLQRVSGGADGVGNRLAGTSCHPRGRHLEHLRTAGNVGEGGRIGAAHPDLRAEPLERVVERRAAPRIEMGDDLVE